MNKIDLIIDALEGTKGARHLNNVCIAEALATARELKALKPVAWAAKSVYGGYEGLSFDKQPRFDIPLYALDPEVTK